MVEPLSASVTAVEAIELARETWRLLSGANRRRILSKEDQYLSYDPAYLRHCYSGEKPVSPALTYTELYDFTKRASGQPALKVAKPFEQKSSRGPWATIVAAGYTSLLKSGRISDNEPLVRVSGFRVTEYGPVFSVQRAEYHDQARSNLILDFDRHRPEAHPSLRHLLGHEYGVELPPLNDRRLANTLGVAALLFYKSRGQWTPYLVRRVKKIGVLPGGLQCYASGAAKWPAGLDSPTFDSLITAHMLEEIEEELNVKPQELEDFRPVAFCREMARGGKPQLFYCGTTSLSRAELTERRAAAAATEISKWQEIERDRWYRSADVVMTPARLQNRLVALGVTLEGAASLFYGVRYLESRVRVAVI